MKINDNNKIHEAEVQMEGAKDVTMRILIGPEDQSTGIIMRKFKIRPGGHTPRHTHNYEHVIKVESNSGILIDENGVEHELKAGQSAFVKPNDLHQFRNPNDKDFEFLCIIPNPNA